MTGDLVWEIQASAISHLCLSDLFMTISFQNQVGDGETLGLVILGSDKTHLSTTQGDKECHALYMTCGNIKKDVRRKATSHAWLQVAHIPVVKFIDVQMQGLLVARLYHQCLDIVCEGLKICSRHPQHMADASGMSRLVRTILIAHLADLPEQCVIAAVHTKACPSSMASHDQMGEADPAPIRHADRTLGDIDSLLRVLDPLNLPAFQKAAKQLGLNGVHAPFWRDWQFAEPCNFLVPDALHQWRKLFMDHIVSWGRFWMGDEEITRRISVLQPMKGYRHFPIGFTHFRQHTGKEHRDLERVWVGVIAGHEKVTPDIMRCVRGFMDFVYTAQMESHSDESLNELEGYLRQFHDNKHAVSVSGARNGPGKRGEFRIPKLELMHHVVRLIRAVGAADQHSTDQTEHCHKILPKAAYSRTNHRDFIPQMCRHADRQEKIRFFSSWTKWRTDPCNRFGEGEGEELDLEHSALGETTFYPGLLPKRTSFKATMQNATTEFSLPTRTHATARVDDVAQSHRIPDLRYAMNSFFKERYGSRIPMENGANLPFSKIIVWDHMRVRLRAVHDPAIFYPPTQVQCLPPNEEMPYGRCNFVLISQNPGSRVHGIEGELSPPFFPCLHSLHSFCQSMWLHSSGFYSSQP